MTSVAEAIRAALLTGEARAKVMATRALARDWRRGALAWGFEPAMPEHPAWPAALELLPANGMPRRGGSGAKAIALWHSFAHIEFVAIDLALDMAGRFGAQLGRDRVLAQGDSHGARILQRILDDEIRHVAAGTKHFVALCERAGLRPENHWKTLVARHFRGRLKPPFNDSARLAAGLSRDYYAAVA